MQMIAMVLQRSAKLPLIVSAAALFFLMVMTFSDVVLRSFFNAPIEAATELTRISMAVMVFAVMPVMSARGQHISVDLLDGVFDRWGLARVRDAVIYLGCGVMLWWPAQRVVVLAERARSYGDVTEYLGIPVFYVSWFIAVMTYMTMAALILRGLAIVFAPHLLEDNA